MIAVVMREMSVCFCVLWMLSIMAPLPWYSHSHTLFVRSEETSVAPEQQSKPEEIVKLNSDEFEKLISLGDDCYYRGDSQGAYEHYMKACSMNALESGIAHEKIGLLLQEKGYKAEALQHLREALVWLPAGKKGNSLRSRALIAIAELRSFELERELKAAYARGEGEAWGEEASKRAHEETRALFTLAQQWDPSSVKVLFAQAQWYTARHDLDNAVKTLQELLLLNPKHTLAHMNIGNMFFRTQQYNEALKWYRLANAVAATKVEKILVLNNIGSLFRAAEDIERSLEHYLQAWACIEKRGGGDCEGEGVQSWQYLEHLYTLDNVMIMMGICIYWKRYEYLEDLKWRYVQQVVRDKESVDPGFSSAYYAGEFKVDMYSFTLGRYHSLYGSRVLAEESCTDPPDEAHLRVFEASRFSSRKVLRVGYISYDWRHHPMGRLTSFLVSHHDPATVQSFAFSYGPDDGSLERKRISHKVSAFVDLQFTPSDFIASNIVMQYDLDILVDLTMWTTNGRVSLTKRRLAPVTINYLGFPATSGCKGYDFVLVDRLSVPPEIHSSFSERLIYVPPSFSYQANDMPLTAAPCRFLPRASPQSPHMQAYSSSVSKKVRTSLRKECQARLNINKDFMENILLCSFNNEKKYEPIVFSAWMNILRRVPTALILLLTPSEFARRNIVMEAAAHGVSLHRIHFLPKLSATKHLHRAAACDLLLDTFVYGAHTTASDMLWQWVPVVSLAASGSGFMPSRVATSILHSMSSPTPASTLRSKNREGINGQISLQPLHAVAYSVHEYEDLVVRLANTDPLLFSLKQKVAINSIRFFSFDKLSRQIVLEQAYQLGWEIRGLVRRKNKLFHIIAGDHAESSNSSRPISRLGEYAVSYLQALDCRIARHRNHPTEEYLDCPDVHPEDDCNEDMTNDDIDAITSARDTVLLRITTSVHNMLLKSDSSAIPSTPSNGNDY